MCSRPLAHSNASSVVHAPGPLHLQSGVDSTAKAHPKHQTRRCTMHVMTERAHTLPQSRSALVCRAACPAWWLAVVHIGSSRGAEDDMVARVGQHDARHRANLRCPAGNGQTSKASVHVSVREGRCSPKVMLHGARAAVRGISDPHGWSANGAERTSCRLRTASASHPAQTCQGRHRFGRIRSHCAALRTWRRLPRSRPRPARPGESQAIRGS